MITYFHFFLDRSGLLVLGGGVTSLLPVFMNFCILLLLCWLALKSFGFVTVLEYACIIACLLALLALPLELCSVLSVVEP